MFCHAARRLSVELLPNMLEMAELNTAMQDVTTMRQIGVLLHRGYIKVKRDQVRDHRDTPRKGGGAVRAVPDAAAPLVGVVRRGDMRAARGPGVAGRAAVSRKRMPRHRKPRRGSFSG